MVCSSILTRANGQETKARLLRTTETLFASKGVAGVTMRVVAKKAKTNLASAHYHFERSHGLRNDPIQDRTNKFKKEEKIRRG